jgi:hypothetical protein
MGKGGGGANDGIRGQGVVTEAFLLELALRFSFCFTATPFLQHHHPLFFV